MTDMSVVDSARCVLGVRSGLGMHGLMRQATIGPRRTLALHRLVHPAVHRYTGQATSESLTRFRFAWQ